jgi:hypothetical protein|nr:hypothetical protein [Moraxella osloensis]
MATLEEKIASKEAQLNALKEKKRETENGQKIIIGGMMLAMARKNPQVARKMIDWIANEVNRDTDKKRLESVVTELKKIADSQLQYSQLSNNQNTIQAHQGLQSDQFN